MIRRPTESTIPYTRCPYTTLFRSLPNVLAGREAAITSAVAGTTRDLGEAPTAIGGAPFLRVDTAGLRESGDVIETIGVERARASLAAADIILWLEIGSAHV